MGDLINSAPVAISPGKQTLFAVKPINIHDAIEDTKASIVFPNGYRPYANATDEKPKNDSSKSPAKPSTAETGIPPLDWLNRQLGQMPVYPQNSPPKVVIGLKSNDPKDPDNNLGKATLDFPVLDTRVNSKDGHGSLNAGVTLFAQHDMGLPRYFRPDGYRNGPTRQNSSAGAKAKVAIEIKEGPVNFLLQGDGKFAPNRFIVPHFVEHGTFAVLPPDPDSCDDQGNCPDPTVVPVGTPGSFLVQVNEPVPDTPVHKGKDISTTGTVEVAVNTPYLALRSGTKEDSFASIGVPKVSALAQVTTGTLFHGKYLQVTGPEVSLFNGGLKAGPAWAASVSRLSYTGQGVPPKGWRVVTDIDLSAAAKNLGGMFDRESKTSNDSSQKSADARYGEFHKQAPPTEMPSNNAHVSDNRISSTKGLNSSDKVQQSQNGQTSTDKTKKPNIFARIFGPLFGRKPKKSSQS